MARVEISTVIVQCITPRQGWKKSKFSEWPAEFSVISSDKSKNFLLKKFLKILQNGGAHGGSKPFMRELLPP